jgi:hypothetical protein
MICPELWNTNAVSSQKTPQLRVLLPQPLVLLDAVRE